MRENHMLSYNSMSCVGHACACTEQAHMCMSVYMDSCMHGKCAATEPRLGPGVCLVKTGRKSMTLQPHGLCSLLCVLVPITLLQDGQTK